MHTSTNWSRLLLIALSICALMLVGCGDDDDDGDSGGGGNNATGPTGDGTAITADNAAVVQAQVQAAAFGVIGKGPGKHDGANSGTVDISISTGKAAQDVSFAMVFDNFSDDGQLWLDGTVNFTQSGANFSYNADLEISGTYSGKVEGSVSVQGGIASGSWTLADGTTINF